MYFEETKKLNELFKYAIAIVLIAGVIAGIIGGMALRVPDYPFEDRLIWTGTGVGVMLATWAMSAITALLLYAKNRQIIMLDMIASSVAGKHEDEPAIEEVTETEQETAAE